MKHNSGAPRLMGILNLTPDSFSDGGLYDDTGKAHRRAAQMLEEGADIIDIGGESTRPGAARITAAEQKARVLDAVAAICERRPRPLVSIDTTLAAVAEAALNAGAGMINDVSAGREDPEMIELAAARRVPICLMHMQKDPQTMQDDPHYDDVVAEVRAFLAARAEHAIARGVRRDNILLDPGIGFGKTTAHNLALINNLRAFTGLGFPVLLGASRKRFMGQFCRAADAAARVAASVAVTVLGAQAGVSVFRVHDVWQHRQALDLMNALGGKGAGEGAGEGADAGSGGAGRNASQGEGSGGAGRNAGKGAPR